MYSIVLEGKVLDFHFKKAPKVKGMYFFYVGDIRVGSVHKIFNYWSAVSIHPNTLCPVAGFRTRYHAAEFLLKIAGLTNG